MSTIVRYEIKAPWWSSLWARLTMAFHNRRTDRMLAEAEMLEAELRILRAENEQLLKKLKELPISPFIVPSPVPPVVPYTTSGTTSASGIDTWSTTTSGSTVPSTWEIYETPPDEVSDPTAKFASIKVRKVSYAEESGTYLEGPLLDIIRDNGTITVSEDVHLTTVTATTLGGNRHQITISHALGASPQAHKEQYTLAVEAARQWLEEQASSSEKP